MLWGASFAQAATVTVTSIDSSYVADGQWFATDVRPGGTATIVNLTGAGGNLENNQPLPTGAAKLTTDGTNAAKAEIGVAYNFGATNVSDIMSTLALGYSFYKANVGPTAPAPSIKLSFLADANHPAANGDNFVTLIYEPYTNPTYNTPTPDVWQSASLNSTTGLFWSNGGLGLANSFAGPPYKTLADWLAQSNGQADNSFSFAHLVGMQVGVGSYNPDQVGYFDAVHLAFNDTTNSNSFDTTYDFQAQAVPEPSTLVIFGLLGMAFVGRTWRSRRESEVNG
jgi:hypothetical protein